MIKFGKVLNLCNLRAEREEVMLITYPCRYIRKEMISTCNGVYRTKTILLSPDNFSLYQYPSAEKPFRSSGLLILFWAM